MKALIFKGKVIQIEDAEFQVASPLFWIDCSEECQVGWVYDEDKGIAVPPEVPEETQEEKLEALEKATNELVSRECLAKGYKDAQSVVTYIHSSNPEWKVEAEKFVIFRDECWLYCFDVESKVKSGEIEAPTVEEFLKSSPTIDW